MQELKEQLEQPDELKTARDEFVMQWGALGVSWGINRTMAQIHALLLVSPEPLSTDQVMEELQISRGNAHTNLKELVDWGLVRGLLKRGERKELFEAEKDVWKIVRTVARERRRRELEPALEVLKKCGESTKKLKGDQAATFNKQIKELTEVTELADTVLRKMADSEKSKIFPLIIRFLK